MKSPERASASGFVPHSSSLEVLREALSHCEACEACLRTDPVFGEGPRTARMVLVGEQPGDEEDKAGRPFVGPAGKMLETLLSEAGVDRKAVYVTNAVKAFHFEERGKRRIHQKPRLSDIMTCRPWLEAEVAAIRPEVIVCMGATAAQAVYGKAVRIGAEHGRFSEHRWAPAVTVTYHPSAALRARESSARHEMMAAITADLAGAALKIQSPRPAR